MMATWKEFAADRPDLAAIGERLLYQYKVGFAFLATIRKDGGPRVHPVCPAIPIAISIMGSTRHGKIGRRQRVGQSTQNGMGTEKENPVSSIRGGVHKV